MYANHYGNSTRVPGPHRSMNYTNAFAHLQNKAKVQQRFQVKNRARVDLHHRYTVHLHGTHAWVRKKDWDRLGPTTQLNLGEYTDKRSEPDAAYNYAVPVPHTPVVLKLFDTDIVFFRADGSVELHAAGFEGVTTAKWMNTATHVRIGNIKPGVWDGCVWGLVDCYGTRTRFYDGLTLDAEGKIISGVRAVAKRGVDRAKAKPWHDAAKHLRALALPFVAMLEGTVIPHALYGPLRQINSAEISDYVLSYPQEFDPAMVTYLATTHLQRVYPDRPLRNVLPRFNAALQRAGKSWIRDHALRQIA